MSESLSFQQIILTLQQYWADHGCLLWYPHSEKVGAGTANPATTLRALGPEPWNVAYVEPSFRPDDGRYGDNPNRMQMHTQFQVILKPDPGNPQALYLNSLYALGVKPEEHDIRFVEDNWESPALGAWGLGWEVWLDGMEITQYTYFQQFGGFDLDPVSVELTYGLERIALFLQGVDSVWEIDWDGTRTYGDVLHRQEVEHCIYDFEVADVSRLRNAYDLFEQEADVCLARGLVAPAHDYVLRCSHAFNLLDSRGAIGVTERASYFARMRNLSRQVAATFLEQREQAGYPFVKITAKLEVEAKAEAKAEVEAKGKVEGLEAAVSFVLEIGTEELPPQDVTAAVDQLSDGAARLLDTLRLDHGAVHVVGTPRRQALIVEGMAPRQRDEEQLVKGPPAKAAFDERGQPTRAAEGFARGQGVAMEDLQVREAEGGRYVFAVRRSEGQPAAEVLAQAVPGLIGGLKFGRSMRWLPSAQAGDDDTTVTFSRPIRWLVCLLGDRVLPFKYAGVVSGRVSRGGRLADSPPIDLENAGDYLDTMAAHGLLVDVNERRAVIGQQVEALAAEAGGTVPEDAALLEEVTNLVEQPTALRGTFDRAYLALPDPVLVMVMKKHQRYFPIVDGQGHLMPHFIAVRNGGTQHLETVRQGNESVLRARFADADFFFKADSAQPLEGFLDRLDTLLFQEQLGSMLDKTRRLERLAPAIGGELGLTDGELETVRRASHLCKADLATQMVIELTSLQGVMGREYARLSGESEAVATAIYEHYLPRFAGDEMPATRPGLVVGIANRLDSLAGLFAVGLAPSGSADPYGLRRDGLGLVTALIDSGIDYSIAKGLHVATELLPGADDDIRGETASAAETESLPLAGGGPETVVACLNFVKRRLEGVLRERGLRHDVVQAALAERGDNPTRCLRAAQALQGWVQRDEWEPTLVAYARSKRIVRPILDDVRGYRLDVGALDADSRDLWLAFQEASEGLGPDREVDEVVEALRHLRDPINTFFDKVLVMAEDEAVRRNRLALVYAIAAIPDGVVDLSQVMGF